MNRYKFNISRCVSIALVPFLFTILICIVIYQDASHNRPPSLKDILIWSGFFLCGVGFFVFLFVNHLPIALKTDIAITGTINKIVEIKQGTQHYYVDFSDIEKIIEYSTSRFPWSSIVLWKLSFQSKEITISSLTVSRLNFERHFHNKIIQKTKFFPWV